MHHCPLHHAPPNGQVSIVCSPVLTLFSVSIAILPTWPILQLHRTYWFSTNHLVRSFNSSLLPVNTSLTWISIISITVICNNWLGQRLSTLFFLPRRSNCSNWIVQRNAWPVTSILASASLKMSVHRKSRFSSFIISGHRWATWLNIIPTTNWFNAVGKPIYIPMKSRWKTRWRSSVFEWVPISLPSMLCSPIRSSYVTQPKRWRVFSALAPRIAAFWLCRPFIVSQDIHSFVSNTLVARHGTMVGLCDRRSRRVCSTASLGHRRSTAGRWSENARIESEWPCTDESGFLRTESFYIDSDRSTGRGKYLSTMSKDANSSLSFCFPMC